MTVKEAMRHKNVLGAGAKKRKKLSPDNRVKAVMSEWKRGTLHSGSGKLVSPKQYSQALAIAMSEKRK